MKLYLRFLFLFLFHFLVLFGGEPLAVYLTLQEAPESSMTICWIEQKSPSWKEVRVRKGEEEEWTKIATHGQILPSRPSYLLYAVSLSGLVPDSRYEFIIENSDRSYFFHTLPKELSRSVKLVVGGDIYHDDIEIVEVMNRVAALQDPDLVILGGDIAYAASKFSFLKDSPDRWIRYLSCCSKTMNLKDGSLIPMVAVIGNHDVSGRFGQTPKQAPYFYFFFPTYEQKYHQLKFGNYLSIWLLDSGHTHNIEGEQTNWLAETLDQSSQTPFKIAIYHVPAYPSVRNYTNEKSSMVRRFWTPLFENYKITAAFEHHDHAYKRTHLIRKGKIDPEGILYLGDGAWGVDAPRRPRAPSSKWYIAKSIPIRHVITVSLFGSVATFQAIDEEGKEFDRTEVNSS